MTIAGTTDTPCEVTHHPSPTENDIEFILGEIRSYLSPDIEVRRGDVLSAWSGIRPLVSDPNKPDSQSLVNKIILPDQYTSYMYSILYRSAIISSTLATPAL